MKVCSACKTEINAAATICPHCRTKQPASKSKKIVYAVLSVIILAAFSRACSSVTPPEPPPKEQVDLSIMRTLVANKITCGDFNWILNSGQTSEYTLNCSKDGKKYIQYTIWPNIQKIQLK